MTAARDVRAIGDELLDFVAADLADDLRSEDIEAALEVHYSPLRCVALPGRSFADEICSVDGYYEAELMRETTPPAAGTIADMSQA